MASAIRVSGEHLSEWVRQAEPGLLDVEVDPPPRRWAPLKPALVRFVRRHRERGAEPPTFSGVPLCLFGSEWPAFPSAAPNAPARGRCAACQARHACAFRAELPDELFPISEAPALQRWRDYGAAFLDVTGSRAAVECTPFVEQIVSTYCGPVSLEPSVLVSNAIDPSARFVVFPHRMGAGAAAAIEYGQVLAGAENICAELRLNRSSDLITTLASLTPTPVPLGLECVHGSWRLKLYLRLEGATHVDKRAVVDALSLFAPAMNPVPIADLHMVGLVLDKSGLHTLKAYVSARPTRQGAAAFPPPLALDHPLVALAGDRALATLDVWSRGARRSNKWDFNVRDHYLAGGVAERLVAELASPQCGTELAPILVGPTYRADIVAIGLRGNTLALYMELN